MWTLEDIKRIRVPKRIRWTDKDRSQHHEEIKLMKAMIETDESLTPDEVDKELQKYKDEIDVMMDIKTQKELDEWLKNKHKKEWIRNKIQLNNARN